MNPQKPDHNQNLIVYALLIMLFVLVMANIIFQWCSKPFEVGAWTALIGPALTIVLGHYYGSRPHSNKRLNILVIDEEEIFTVRIKMGFNKRDFEANIMTVTRCEEALKAMRQDAPYEMLDRPDVVITGLTFRNSLMQGVDFVEAVRTDQKLFDTPIVVLQGASDVINEQALSVLDSCKKIGKHEGIDALINAIRVHQKLSLMDTLKIDKIDD